MNRAIYVGGPLDGEVSESDRPIVACYLIEPKAAYFKVGGTPEEVILKYDEILSQRVRENEDGSLFLPAQGRR